jgi:hypothetical protein
MSILLEKQQYLMRVSCDGYSQDNYACEGGATADTDSRAACAAELMRRGWTWVNGRVLCWHCWMREEPKKK